jgi:Spy/CpxP family protein refolding chaperone
MRTLPSLVLATLLAGSACLAEENATPPTPPGAQPPTAGQPGQPGGPDRGRDGFIKRLIAEDPALKDVDPNTPEGKEKIEKAMQARMEKRAPEMRQRIAEQQAQSHAKLREALTMPTEDFTAVEPLITKVENLRLQGRLADPQGLPFGMGRGGPGGGRGGGPPGGFNPMRMMMGDTPLDPSVQEIQDAAKALTTLLADAQANGNEVTATMARLRKARETFKATLGKAQEELRSVMTPRQEAVLVDRGILD